MTRVIAAVIVIGCAGCHRAQDEAEPVSRPPSAAKNDAALPEGDSKTEVLTSRYPMPQA